MGVWRSVQGEESAHQGDDVVSHQISFLQLEPLSQHMLMVVNLLPSLDRKQLGGTLLPSLCPWVRCIGDVQYMLTRSSAEEVLSALRRGHHWDTMAWVNQFSLSL